MNILPDFASGDFVGWVERSEPHHAARRNLVGLTSFDPPYRKSPYRKSRYRKLPRRVVGLTPFDPPNVNCVMSHGSCFGLIP